MTRTSPMGKTEADRSVGFQARHHEPAVRSPAVDQLLSRKARSRAQIGEVPLRGARTDAYGRGRVSNGSPGGDEGREDVDLAGGRRPRECSAQVAVSHAEWLTRGSRGCA